MPGVCQTFQKHWRKQTFRSLLFMLSLSILTITVIVDIIANCEEQQANMQSSALSSWSTGFVETETSAISVIKAYGIPI